MIKNHYLKELEISKTYQKGTGNSKKEIQKIQSWLCLQERLHPGIGTFTSIDGDFGNATEACVKNFQKYKGLSQTGIVTPALFAELCKPIKSAFEGVSKKATVRQTILAVAEHHLKQKPKELVIAGQSNSGPWVRAYMGGNEGTYWYWCMGFVQAVIDQAFSLHEMDFREMMPITYSCDTVGNQGLNKNCLLRYTDVRSNPSKVKEGDVMLIRRTKYDWIHTGIVIDVNSRNGTFTLIEGNTNSLGSRNGDGVYKKVRNFRASKLEVFGIHSWVNSLDFELRNLKEGSRGKAVHYLEEILKNNGYNEVIVSEYFGKSTDRAVKTLQRRNGLYVDGIVGPKTWTAVLELAD